MKKFFQDKILSSSKNTVLFIFFTILSLLSIYQIVLLCMGTCYNSDSDDIVQYSPILLQYIEMIKKGELTWFNFTNSFGASSFADIYYLPIDIFSLLVFLLSYLMRGEIAFSCVELLKIVLGVTTFAYYLKKKNISNKYILLVSFMYFAYGGMLTYSTYPTYLSLYFYLPFSLLMVELYKKNKIFLPLYCFGLVFYNFYNAYMLFIFMLLAFIIGKIKDDYKGFKNLIWEAFKFGMHIVLGVLMSMIILVPSVMYIVKYTYRENESFSLFYNHEVYLRMLLKMFTYENSTNGMKGSIITEGRYILNQYSYFIGYLGIYLLSFILISKDKKFKVYKYSIFVIGFMMIFSIFSMIFSGNATPYNRWFSFINIYLFYVIAYFLENKGIESFSTKEKKRNVFVLLGIYGTIFAIFICLVFMSNGAFYKYGVVTLALHFVLVILYFIFYLAKQKDLLEYLIVGELIFTVCYNFSTPITREYRELDKIEYSDNIKDIIENKIEIDDNSLNRVYVSDNVLNLNRYYYSKVLTSEYTFHSFINSSIVNDFKSLYEDGNHTLYVAEMNRFDYLSERIMNYKYYVMNNNLNYSYLNEYIYGSSEDYMIYSNDDYEPFYVYKNYYNSNEIGLSNYINLEINLFDGVILDDDYSNLNKIEYKNYGITKKNIYENVEYKQNKILNVNCFLDEGIVHLFGEDFVIEYNGKEYSSSYGLINLKIVKGNNEIKILNSSSEYLDYVVSYEDENENLFLIYELNEEEKNKDFLAYQKITRAYFNKLKIADVEWNTKDCYDGTCFLDSDSKYIIVSDVADSLMSEKSEEYSYFWSYAYDESFYEERKNDNNGENKILEYKDSTIKVKYDRLDTSSDEVIVIPVSYSDEWEITSSNGDYSIVQANEGFIGILIKGDTSNVEISLSFKPAYASSGIAFSVAGFTIYFSYIIYFKLKKRREENNEKGNEQIN